MALQHSPTGRTGYVITANDSIEAICLGTQEEAERLRDKMKADYIAWYHKHAGASAEVPNIYWAARETAIL